MYQQKNEGIPICGPKICNTGCQTDFDRQAFDWMWQAAYTCCAWQHLVCDGMSHQIGSICKFPWAFGSASPPEIIPFHQQLPIFLSQPLYPPSTHNHQLQPLLPTHPCKRPGQVWLIAPPSPFATPWHHPHCSAGRSNVAILAVFGWRAGACRNECSGNSSTVCRMCRAGRWIVPPIM